MKLSKAKAARAVRWASLDWEAVADPRQAQGKRHPHPGMLSLLVAAFASGARTLRQVEALSDDMAPAARRRIGLKVPVSDTALDELLRRQEPEGLAEVLERQVKDGLKSKAIQNDAFDEGVLAVDGKKLFVGNFAAHPLCQKHSRDDGTPYWMLFAQRAVLISSSAKPCVAQNFIADKEQEVSEFADFFKELTKRFGKSFELVTSDAGACSRKNAAAVHEANKGYFFALKLNQPNAYAESRSRLSTKETPGDEKLHPEFSTTERYCGATITRALFRSRLEENDELIDMPGARMLVRIRQTSVRDEAGTKPVIEDRYFVTNRNLGAEKALKLVRLHWGIENNAFWTLDAAMGEDLSTPCQQQEALVVVSWLRLLAYNMVSLFRSKQPKRHGDKTTWRRAFDLLKLVFLDAAAVPANEVALAEAPPATLA